MLDATGLSAVADGLSIYIVNLLRHLPQDCFTEMDFTVLLNDKVDRADLTEAIAGKPIDIWRARIASIGPRRDIQFALFLRRHPRDFNLIHVLSSNYPLALRGGICTIHDVTFRTAFDRKRGAPGTAVAAKLYLAFMTRFALRNADALIAVSHATRREIIRYFAPARVAERKIRVIHEGWEHIQRVKPSGDPFPFEDDGFLLFLGSYRVHKNLGKLLEAFARAMPQLPRCKTLIISGSSGRLAKLFRSSINEMNAGHQRVIFTGYISNEAVRRLLEKADALILPSLSEGFGLPVLEAFATGTPVLCSNTTALPEVGGDAALYFDPTSPDSIAQAILHFYSDPELSPRLQAAGRKRLRQFSWTRAASETVELYRQILKTRACSSPNTGASKL